MSRIQPGRAAVRRMMAKRGWRYADLAERIGVQANHLQTCLSGKTHPMPEVRKALPRLTGLTLEEIFDEASLSKPYDASKNPWKELQS